MRWLGFKTTQTQRKARKKRKRSRKNNRLSLKKRATKYWTKIKIKIQT